MQISQFQNQAVFIVNSLYTREKPKEEIKKGDSQEQKDITDNDR